MQGQSEYTEWKERGIAAAGVAVTGRIFAPKFRTRFPFWMFDLFSGAGWNEKADCLGSPIAMLREAKLLGLDYRLHTVDIDAAACEALMARSEIAQEYGHRIFAHHGDNAEFAGVARELVRQRERPDMAMGVWLCDPNDSSISMELLRNMGKFLPRMDVLLNVTGSAIKRANGAGGAKATVPELMEQCGKRYWLIREPAGKFQWSLLIGRNFEVGDYPGMGFYRLESSKGRDAFETLTQTKAQLRADAMAKNADLPFL